MSYPEIQPNVPSEAERLKQENNDLKREINDLTKELNEAKSKLSAWESVSFDTRIADALAHVACSTGYSDDQGRLCTHAMLFQHAIAVAANHIPGGSVTFTSKRRRESNLHSDSTSEESTEDISISVDLNELVNPRP